ncbi:MAG TPA: hypothetical protein VFQ65_17975 [Kofleriaceae bacterium]|nr:hypothetical protein [Kofleriaceae bacterium]
MAGALSFAVACSWGGSSDPNSHPDAGGTAGAVCGDGTCSASEINNCPQDCGSGGHGSNGSGSGSNVQAVCGNNTCDPGETAQTCPSDCTGGGSGSGTCPSDVTTCALCAISGTSCPTGMDMNSCFACLFGGLGSGGNLGCDGGAADGICQADETNATCPADCP